MKTLITFLVFLFLGGVASTIAITPETSGSIELDYFSSLGALAAIVIPVTSALNRILNLSGQWKQVLSWIVSIALGFVAWGLDLGIFAGITWYVSLLYSISAGFIANGIFDIELIKEILKSIGLEPKKDGPRM